MSIKKFQVMRQPFTIFYTIIEIYHLNQNWQNIILFTWHNQFYCIYHDDDMANFVQIMRGE